MPVTKIFRSFCCIQAAEEANTSFPRVATSIEETVEVHSFPEEKKETNPLPIGKSDEASATVRTTTDVNSFKEIARPSVFAIQEASQANKEVSKGACAFSKEDKVLVDWTIRAIEDSNAFFMATKHRSFPMTKKQLKAIENQKKKQSNKQHREETRL